MKLDAFESGWVGEQANTAQERATVAKPLPKEWKDSYGDNPSLSDPELVTKDYPEPITREVPTHLRRGGVGRVQRPKECHHRAMLYVLSHRQEPGVRLVYGSIHGDIEHSWVELPENITFDGTRMEFYRTDEYRRALHAQPVHMHTAMDACKLMVGTGHTGPWREAECLAILGRNPGIQEAT